MTSVTDSALSFVHSARPALGHAFVAEVLADTWGITGTLEDVGGDRDQNLVVTTANGDRYLCKIGQPDEDIDVLDMQIAALMHVSRQDPGLRVPAVIPAADGKHLHTMSTGERGSHCFRVFSYVNGRPIADTARPSALMRGAGSMLARLDRALQGFFHPHAEHRLLWDIRQASAIRDCADDIGDPAVRDRVLRILDDFTEKILPRFAGLRSQVIHGDATSDNVLADGSPPSISGLIDFGDAVHAPLVQELAVAMADTPYGLEQPWNAACEVAAGYDERFPLEIDETVLLWDMARARLALTLAVLGTRSLRRSEGSGSMASCTATCLRQLEAFEALGREQAFSILRNTLRLPESVALNVDGETAVSTDALLALRRKRLMPGMALFYPEEPLHVLRGEGMWLFDVEGRAFLDCYNNVPHVGHGHPHVVNAIARQSAALNTNTRYLYDSVLEYAERLTALLPAELSMVLFVNSGSEANDLAWRIAMAYTGRSGAIVTASAYHGCTEAAAALSPYGTKHADSGTRTIVPPDTFRGPFRQGGPDPAACWAIAGKRAVRALNRSGHGTAALFVDPIFASDGILDAPDGCLAALFEQVRADGGLCVADEVQTGFGRLGTNWGFEAHDVVPDIVTLGKPAANGYPLGAVITTPEVVAAFARQHDWFSTFGGNPVACTAGLAVLDVVEREGLRNRAAAVGGHLRERLAELGTRHALIGDVRGRGLFLGVELVRDRETLEPADEEADHVALALRRDGVLVGIEGPHANVLKIRPPLICRHEHADRLVDALDRTLSGCC